MKIILLIFYQILLSSASAFVLGFLILLVKRIFRYRLGAKWHYYIWLLLLVKLLIPYAPESNLSMFNVLTPAIQQVPAIKAFYSESLNRDILDTEDISTAVRENKSSHIEEKSNPENILTSGDTPEAVHVQNTAGSRNINYQNTLKTLFFIWLTGFILLICFIAYENIKFQNKISSITLCTDQRINEILGRCMEKLGVKRHIPIFWTVQVGAPSLYGAIKPKIIISTSITEKFNDDEIKYILLHELSHYKRKDILTNWLFTLLQLIHWFNPMVWYSFYIMRQDCEIACDAEVLSCLEESEKNKYGQTIINLLKLFTGAYFIPSTAGLVKGKSGMRRRIKMISVFKKRKWASMLGAVTLLVVLATIGLPNAKLLADSDEVIHFKDSNIQAAVEKSLGQPAGSIIKKTDMQKVKDINISKVSNASDIKYCTSLESLTLDIPIDFKLLGDIKTLKSLRLGYKVSDLKDLKYCKNVESLSVSSFQAKSLSVFADELPRLKDLSIGFPDGINGSNTDLSGLKKLEQLNTLALYGLKGKSNFNELGGMKQLKYLSLFVCSDLENIDSLSFLSHLQIIGKTKLTNESIQVLVEFKNLKELFIEELTIKDMKPFEKLTELESLTIMNAYITDINPLKNLTKLKTLNLAGNRIRDISALENMKDLRNIELQVNKIENIQPLSNLKKIETLWLSENEITDISALSGLTNLKTLYLYRSKITDISPLSNLENLKEVNLDENQIEIINPLKGLKAVETISLSNNRLSDINGLSGLTNLKKVNLMDNRIVHVGPLAGLVNLTELNLDDNKIKDIKPLAALPKIEDLSVDRNKISDISTIGAMKGLVSFGASENAISDITALAGLSRLESIRLGGTGIDDKDIAVLAGLPNLKYIVLPNNKISDISPLKSLVNIYYLNLSKNNISDISALANMKKIQYLYLQDNQIADITVLGKLDTPELINLRNNRITDVGALARFKEARLILKGNNITDYSPVSSFYNPADESN